MTDPTTRVATETTVLGIDLASRSWADFGTALLSFTRGADPSWTACRVNVITWPDLPLTPENVADAIDKTARKLGVSAVSIDGPQGWREPQAEHHRGAGRLCETETNPQGKTGAYGVVYPHTYEPWVRFSIAVFAELTARPHVTLANDVAAPLLDLLPVGHYYLLECFPTSTWRTSGLVPLPGHAKAPPSVVESYAQTLQTHYGLPLSAITSGHDNLQAVVAALPAAGLLAGPCRVVPRGVASRYVRATSGTPAHRVEGLIWDARPQLLPGGTSPLVIPPVRVATDNNARLAERMPEVSAVRSCLCGCGGVPKWGRFLPGHDGKLKGMLLRRIRQGDETARDELRQLGWEKFAPPVRSQMGQAPESPSYSERQNTYTAQPSRDEPPNANPPYENSPMLVVSQSGGGHYRTIGEAIRAAMPHTRIYVRTGVYTEDLYIDKPVEIIGVRGRGRVHIQLIKESCIHVASDEVTLDSLVIEQGVDGSEAGSFAILSVDARFTIKDCEVSSLSGIGVYSTGAQASTHFLRCRIHDCAKRGVLFLEGSTGYLEDCQLLRNHPTHLSVGDSSSVRLSRCGLSSSTSDGITVSDDASSSLEDCRIIDAGSDGMSSHGSGRISLHRTIISNSFSAGVSLYYKSIATITRSQLSNSQRDGLLVTGQCVAIVSESSINGNGFNGVVIANESVVTLIDCDLTLNIQEPFFTLENGAVHGHGNRLK